MASTGDPDAPILVSSDPPLLEICVGQRGIPWPSTSAGSPFEHSPPPSPCTLRLSTIRRPDATEAATAGGGRAQIANESCPGRVVSVLEGGYRIQGGVVSAFARSTASHVGTLARPTGQQWSHPAANQELFSDRPTLLRDPNADTVPEDDTDDAEMEGDGDADGLDAIVADVGSGGDLDGDGDGGSAPTPTPAKAPAAVAAAADEDQVRLR